MKTLLRERGLALVALLLAVVGLASGGGGAGSSRIDVVVAARALPAGSVLRAGQLRIRSISTADRSSSMALRRSELVGRTVEISLAAGDYVLRSGLAGAAHAVPLRAGDRAVPLSLDATSAPPLALLRAGAQVDVVSEHDADRDGPAHGELLAHRLTLLSGARATDGALVVTVRAPLAVALKLATAQAQERRLQLLALPEVNDG
jgi:Flp pilus assembly protein CpaB